MTSNFGLSLKEKFFDYLAETKLEVDFFEIHAENYTDQNSANYDKLVNISKDYPISIHSVGLSLGSTDQLDQQHLQKIKSLKENLKAKLVSDHLSWVSFNGNYFHDLLPLPYTKEVLALVSDKIKFIQDYLGCQFIIENPSLYLRYNFNEYSETDFLNQLCDNTGCGLILDINNIAVCAHNLNFKADDYLKAIPGKFVKEIHLAQAEYFKDYQLYVDSHLGVPTAETLALCKSYLQANTELKTNILFEWDTNVPELKEYYQSAQQVKKELSC